MARLSWFSYWHDSDSIQPFGWRRMWTFSRNRMGFVSRGFIVVYMVMPHLIMFMGTFLLGLTLLAGCPFGLTINEIPNALGLLLLPFGGFGCALLIPFILGRKAVMLDRKKGEVVQYGGVALILMPMLPLAWKRTPLASFQRVTLDRYYSIRLCGAASGDILVVKVFNELRAREIAEKVALFAGLPLVDETSAQAVTREPGRLDEPLAEKARRTGEADATPAKPMQAKGAYAQEGPEAVFRIAAPPFAAGWAVKALLACMAMIALSCAFAPPYPPKPAWTPPVEAPLQPVEEPSLWPWRLSVASYYLLTASLYLGAAGVLIALLAFLILEEQRPYGYEVRADPQGLRVHVRWLGLSWTHALPSGELEELRVEKDPRFETRLAAISDRKIVRFAHGLTEGEARYLRAFLVKALAK